MLCRLDPFFCSLQKWKAIFAHRTCLWYTHQILLLIRIHRHREIESGRLLSCYWFGFDFGSSYQSQYRLTLFILFFCTLTHARLSSQSSAIGEIYMRLTTQQNLHFIAIYYSLNATKWFYSSSDFILFFLVYWTSSFLHKFYNTIEKWCMCFLIFLLSLSLSHAPLRKHLKRFIYVWEWHYYKITFLFGAIFASTINNVLRMHSICDDMTLLSHYFDTNQHKINDANFRWFFSRFLHVNLACKIHKRIRETYRLVNSHTHILFLPLLSFSLGLILNLVFPIRLILFLPLSLAVVLRVRDMWMWKSNWRWWYIENNQHIFAWQFNAVSIINVLLLLLWFFWCCCSQLPFLLCAICFVLLNFWFRIFFSIFISQKENWLSDLFMHWKNDAKRVAKQNLHFQKSF